MDVFIPILSITALGLLAGGLFFFGFNLDQTDKRTFIYAIVALIVGLLLGGLTYLVNRSSLDSALSYHILQLIFIGLGSFHAWFLYRKMFWSRRDSQLSDKDSFLPEFLYTLFTMLLMTAGFMLPLGYFYQNFEKATPFWSVSLLFIIPFFLAKTFDFLNQIPSKDYSQKWSFSKDRISEDDWDWANEMWINFEVRETLAAQRTGRGRYARFRILVPRQTPIREVYRLAVREYNRKSPEVVVQDLGFERGNDGRFWWLFSVKFIWNHPNTWFRGIRHLDPYDSVVANDLRAEDIITARRKSFQNGEALDYGEVAMGEL